MPLHIRGDRQVCGVEVSVWLLSAVSFVDAADSAVLGASMIAMEKDLGLSPVGLSMLYAGGGVSISIFGIVWGILADRCSRKLLLVRTCTAWGVLSVLQAGAASVPLLFLLRWGQQAMLSALGPIAQSVVADVVEAERRGAMFGRMNMGGALGGLLITPLALILVEMTIPIGRGGIAGWRVLFLLVGLLGLCTGAGLLQFMEEPRRDAVEIGGGLGDEKRKPFNCKEELSRFPRLMKIPSFAVLLGQGLFGCVAAQSQNFSLVYLRLCGHSGSQLSVLSIFTGIAGLMAAPIGGAIPDAMAQRSPAHGRAYAAQVSVLLGTVFFAAWVSLGRNGSIGVLTMLFCLQVLTSQWVTPGTKLPILSEIVPAAERATTMAWLASLEGTFGGIVGPPAVGFLAERVFHYQPESGGPSAGGNREENSRALGTAMLWCTVVPWMVQVFVFFPLLHMTYAKDVARARGVQPIRGPLPADFAVDPPRKPGSLVVGKNYEVE